MCQTGNKEKTKKVFLDDLPRWRFGKKKPNGEIDWKNSIGYKVKFIYENISGELIIKDYNSKTQCLTIKYLNKEPFLINTAHFQKCKLGKLLGKITGEFKIEIGKHFKDDKRNLIIIDKEYRKDKKGQNKKWYKYKCEKCGWNEGWIIESHLSKGHGCSCCFNQIAVLGINTIWDTDRWMCDLGVSEEDAKKYTYGSNKKIIVICRSCGKEKNIKISDIFRNHSISCTNCGDGISYPEKFIDSVLKQLNVEFIHGTSFKWAGKRQYDFYIPSLNCIIETHGRQHYEDDNSFYKSLKFEQENDRNKEQLAKEKGVKCYIVIDCRKSELEWIKDNIIKSELPQLLNFKEENINWIECEENALSNLIKKACDIKKDNPSLTCNDIAIIMSMSRKTIRRYLKNGDLLGWCEYNVEKEIREGKRRTIKNNKNIHSTRIKIFKDGKELGEYPSIINLITLYKTKFNIELQSANISKVCQGQRNHHKGFTFKYVQDDNKIINN